MTWLTDTMLDAVRDLRIAHGDHYLLARCDHATLAAAMREAGLVADALVVDAPYSERTHAGHVVSASDGARRRTLEYDSWSRAHVRAFIGEWAPIVRGWIASISDDELALGWKRELERAGRYSFPLIPCTERGGTVRMTGDGPSSCTTHLSVARPRSRDFMAWGVTESHYIGPREKKLVVGGKPLWLMRAIVGDYSREGDLVVDPCMGAGTTLVAAVELGRRAIGCEPDAGRFELAARRLARARPQMRMRLDVEAVEGEQLGLEGS